MRQTHPANEGYVDYAGMSMQVVDPEGALPWTGALSPSKAREAPEIAKESCCHDHCRERLAIGSNTSEPAGQSEITVTSSWTGIARAGGGLY